MVCLTDAMLTQEMTTQTTLGFDQPPMILLHGTEDWATPYVNGKAIYDRAQEVGVPSALITIEGGGHMIQNEIFENRFDEMTTSMYELMTMGAQAPAGCV